MNEVITTSYNPCTLPCLLSVHLWGLQRPGLRLQAAGLSQGAYQPQSGQAHGQAPTHIHAAQLADVLRHAVCSGAGFWWAGVWCMHFIGTLALQLPVAVHYSLDTTLLSLVAAVLASICGLGIVAANPYSLPRLVCAGAILGVGVSAMHYLGMYSMEFDGFFLWDWPLVALSCLIAFVAATAGLWLAFATSSNAARWLAAALMGGAVCAMHYTGMAAAEVVCTTPVTALPESDSLGMLTALPVLLVMLIVVISFLIALVHMYARRFKT